MDIEWDAQKAAENLRKHGVGFPEAIRIFHDPHRIEREDTRMPYGETRMQVIGLVSVRVLVVIYTLRADRIRIISARKANQRERRAYDTSKAPS
jgi:uncharacterized DUF497 family protein